MRLQVVKGAGAPAVRDLGVLVSRRRAEARERVDALLDGARREAERLLEEARREADAVRREAREAGLRDGERRWAEAAAELAARRSDALARAERDCVHLAVEIARQLVAAELSLSRNAIEAIVARAIAPLRRDAALSLRVSEADAAAAAALEARLGASRSVEISVDASLAQGDCIAECAGVRVDARLATALEAVERRLLGAAGGTP